MESIWDLGIQLIIALQSLGSWLEVPMRGLSFLGQQEFYLLVAPAIYWCYDSSAGLKVGLYLMLSIGFNAFFKLAFLQPRPYWYSDKVIAYWGETSFGLPSGHAMNSTVFFGALGREIRQKWAYWAAGVLAFLVGLSRIYLAAHFPTDVLAGWLLGILLLWGIAKLEKPAVAWLQGRAFWQQAAAAFGVSLLIIVPSALILTLSAGWEMSFAWQANIIKTTGSLFPLDAPRSLESVFTASGAFFGMAVGALWLNIKGGFAARPRDIRFIAARLVLGVIVVLALYMGLGVFQPDEESLVSYLIRYGRYTLIGVWISAGAPLVFNLLKI